MIHVLPDTKIVFVRGVYSFRAIEAAILEATGKKRINVREWTFVGLADDDARGLQVGAGFSPPDDGRYSIGYKITSKRDGS